MRDYDIEAYDVMYNTVACFFITRSENIIVYLVLLQLQSCCVGKQVKALLAYTVNAAESVSSSTAWAPMKDTCRLGLPSPKKCLSSNTTV